MASALQVMSALQQQVQAACAALPGLNVAVGIDFPPIKTLMANVRGGTAVVSVFDRKQTRNTTRWMPIVLGQTITATELVATLSNSTIAAGATETITLSGTITPGDAVSMVMTNRTQPPTEFVTYTRTWATVALVQSGDTLTTLAARLAEQIAADPLLPLRKLAESGMTMIVVTHEMGFAREVADRVLFIDGGVIVEQGPARELLNHPKHPRTQDFLRRILHPM